jgi:DNA-binding transcriptional LysR family regulator
VLALDKYRNFARAAEAIGITQPALTRSIQSVEEAIGARVFDRDRKQVEPTAVGSRLIEQAANLLSAARNLEQEVQRVINLEGGQLYVGAGPYPAEISVGIAVGRMVRRHPQIRIDVLTGDWPELTKRILAGELDVAIAETSLAQADDRLVIEQLPPHQAFYFCRSGHALASQAKLTIDDIRRYPLVTTSIPARLFQPLGRRNPDDGGNGLDGPATTEIRTTSALMIRQVVRESDAVGVALPSQIGQEVALGRLVQLPLVMPGLVTGYGIIRLAHRTLSPAASVFVGLLREVEAEIEG